MQKIAEGLTCYIEMIEVQHKLNSAIESYKELFANDLEETFTNDEGQVLMDDVKEFIISTLAVKKAETPMKD